MQLRPTNASGKRDSNASGTSSIKHQHAPSGLHEFAAEQKGQFIINQVPCLVGKKAKKIPAETGILL